ncbi:MAG: cupin domain-containing protein [Alphaproteobacteria bacterium]|nr:cupin domain-containing protein [Alphaproteobacteria bacterium]
MGSRLRHHRMMLGKKLKDVAEIAGCSESLLSKLENGRANPSVRMLHRVAVALEINVASLFADDGSATGLVTRAGDRPLIDTEPSRGGHGVRMQRLIPYAGGHMLQGNIHIVDPGGESSGYLEHAGEEVGYIIEGEIELTVDNETVRLQAGDSFNFRSERPHKYRNPGKSEAKIVWINTPPTF